MLKGEITTLRAITREDLPRLWEFRQDLDLGFLADDDPPRPLSLARMVAEFDEGKGRPFVLEFAIEAEDLCIGDCGLSHLDETAGTCLLYVTIGDRRYWGRGCGRDAVRLLLRYAFHIRNLHRVWLSVHSNNERAIRCYRACGFVEEGRLRRHLWIDGAYVDLVHMGILREEWQQAQSG